MQFYKFNLKIKTKLNKGYILAFALAIFAAAPGLVLAAMCARAAPFITNYHARFSTQKQEMENSVAEANANNQECHPIPAKATLRK